MGLAEVVGCPVVGPVQILRLRHGYQRGDSGEKAHLGMFGQRQSHFGILTAVRVLADVEDVDDVVQHPYLRRDDFPPLGVVEHLQIMGERTRIVRMILQGKATEHVVVDDEGAAVVDARHIGLQHLDVAAHRIAVLQFEPGLGDACPEQLAYGRIAAGDGPVEVRRHVDNDRILTPGIDVAVDALRIVVEGLLDDASP